MLHEDEPGRYKLSQREYMELMQIFAAFSALKKGEPWLKDRIRTIPNGWRDYKMIMSRMDWLTEELVHTIPTRKLLAMRQDMKNAQMRIYMQGAPASDTYRDVVSVDEEALIELIDVVISMECMLCEKKGNAMKKCPYLKIIESILPYERDPDKDPPDGSCQMAGRTSVAWGGN